MLPPITINNNERLGYFLEKSRMKRGQYPKITTIEQPINRQNAGTDNRRRLASEKKLNKTQITLSVLIKV